MVTLAVVATFAFKTAIALDNLRRAFREMIDFKQRTNIYESPAATRGTLILYPSLTSDEGVDQLKELLQSMGTEEEYVIGQGTLPLSARSIGLVLPESEAIDPGVLKSYMRALAALFPSLSSLTCFLLDIPSMVRL